ncbi:MAG: VOC family protein [Pseudomonadota bacterium]
MAGLRAMPVLPVRDVALAVDFYRRVGFHIGGIWPARGTPSFAIMAWGTVTLALDREGGGHGGREGWQAYLYVTDSEGLHAHLTDIGIPVERGPEEAFYGCVEIDVRDPDGNLVCFATDLTPGPDGPGL